MSEFAGRVRGSCEAPDCDRCCINKPDSNCQGHMETIRNLIEFYFNLLLIVAKWNLLNTNYLIVSRIHID